MTGNQPNLVPAFDSLISLKASPIAKKAPLDKLFNDFFVFEKLVKYNFMNVKKFNRIET